MPKPISEDLTGKLTIVRVSRFNDSEIRIELEDQGAVTLQGRVSNSAPDTDGWGGCVFSRDKQINVAFADGKGVPPFKVQEISQEHTVTKSDFSVPVTGGLYGYC